jgi:hypothetical protein
MNSNLDLFLERMALEAEDQGDVFGEPIWDRHSPALA